MNDSQSKKLNRKRVVAFEQRDKRERQNFSHSFVKRIKLVMAQGVNETKWDGVERKQNMDSEKGAGRWYDSGEQLDSLRILDSPFACRVRCTLLP